MISHIVSSLVQKYESKRHHLFKYIESPFLSVQTDLTLNIQPQIIHKWIALAVCCTVQSNAIVNTNSMIQQHRKLFQNKLNANGTGVK